MPERDPVAAPGASGRPDRAEMDRRTFLRLFGGAAAAIAAAAVGGWAWLLRGSAALPSPTAVTRGSTSAPTAATLQTHAGAQGPMFVPHTLAAGRSPGYLFISPASLTGAICEDDGNPIWVHKAENAGDFILDPQVGTYRGRPVLIWWEGPYGDVGFGDWVVVDEAYEEVARVRAGNGLRADGHELILTSEDTALLMANVSPPSPLAPDGSHELYDLAIQEIDLATGEVLFDWRALAHLSVDESYSTPVPGKAYDWFHGNSIDVDRDGNLLVSARNTSALYKINPTTGDVIWRLGGKRSDFAMGPGASFAWQHDARRQPDGTLTLFDDGSSGTTDAPIEPQARGLVLDVDETARTVRLVREYVHSPSVLAWGLGNVQRFPSGNVLVGWGSAPAFTEFDAQGRVVLEAALPEKSFSYRTLRFPWRGRPAQPPLVAAEIDGSAEMSIRVSWNGATDVAAWVVLGGDSADRLTMIGTAPRMGFETLIRLPARPPMIAVRALDRAGATLVETAAQAT